MKTILVTGASGFAGSHIVLALQETDKQIIAACRERNRLPSGFKGEARVGDLRDESYRRQLLENVDVVCHAAAWSSLWGHAGESRRLFLEPTLALLEQCKESGVKRFVFLSTTSAAAPDQSGDPQSRGIQRKLWPHLCSIVEIEDRMQELSRQDGMEMVNLRCGLFVGERYGLGILPILLPRLKTHLVPWIKGGCTGMPLIDGVDIGQAFRLAAVHPKLEGFQGFNIVGPEIPTAREVIAYLHREFGYPQPHFSVPIPIGYVFARMMELLDPLVPWEPLVVRSIVHLLEETGADNRRAAEILGYHPEVHWQQAIKKQVLEMQQRQKEPMAMAVPVAR